MEIFNNANYFDIFTLLHNLDKNLFIIKKLTILFTAFFIYNFSVFAQAIIIDHSCTGLSLVPIEWVNQAKEDLKIWYGHTSHGSQITSGINNLQNNIGEPYTYNSSGAGGALSYQEQTGVDLGHNGDTSWAQVTRNVLNQPGNDRNVIMWSWCGGCSDNTEQGINIYLNKMTELENDYPDVKFIYMTGHLDIWAWENLKARNQQIRDYCIANDKILFDFADIESYNPDSTYFEYATDNCNYYSGPGGTYLGNWATKWCNTNPGSDLCWSCYCAHSESLNCNLKGRAFWWMISRMAGWDGTSTKIDELFSDNYNLKNQPNPFNDKTIISFKLNKTTNICLKIYDISGKLIDEIINETKPAGKHQIIFSPKNLQTGIYYYQFITEDEILIKKMLCLN